MQSRILKIASLFILICSLQAQTFKRHFENIGIDSVLRHDSLGTVPVYTSAARTILVKRGTVFNYYGAGYFGEVYHNLDSVFGSSTGDGWWGDGSDGSVTLTGNVSLSRDMFYDNLTIPAGDTLRPRAYRIFVKGVLSLSGVISSSGGNAGNGGNGGSFLCNTSTGYGGVGGSAGSSDSDGYAGANGTAALAGRGRAGSAGSVDSTDCVSGVTQFGGTVTCTDSGVPLGSKDFDATQVTLSIGQDGGVGGHGGTGGDVIACGGGTGLRGCPGRSATFRVTLAASSTWLTGEAHSLIDIVNARTFPRTSTNQTFNTAFVTPFRYSALSSGGGCGGAGGAHSGGGHVARGGGGAGGGGAGGNAGPVFLIAKTISGTGKILANGGNGGVGGNGGDGWVSGSGACGGAGGGGGGGAGGNGHVIYIIYRGISGVTIQTIGGTGGLGGIKGVAAGLATDAADGDAGQNGTDGVVIYYTL